MNTRQLLARIEEEGTPLIDHDQVTFVWRGLHSPELRGDITGWQHGEPLTLEHIATGFWIYQTHLPMDAYIEYAYTKGEERYPDPYNIHKVPDGFGEYNHSFSMPLAEHTDLVHRKRDVPAGRISRHQVETQQMVAGRKRRVFLYQPQVEQPCPLVVVWDGNDYLRRARLAVILDNLIAQRRVQPVALAMVAHGGPLRGIEYACSESTLWFLDQVILPLAHEHLNLVDIGKSPGSFGVVGASLGGLMALFTALRRPDVFGKVLSQSGAFGFHNYENIVFDLVRYLPVTPMSIWMDVGTFDLPPLPTPNQRMAALLNSRGYRVVYREYSGGHNYTSWQDEVWRGLENLYPWRAE